MSDTWTSCDLPVLQAVVAIFGKEDGRTLVPTTEIEQVSGLAPELVQRALRSLYRQAYVFEPVITWGGKFLASGAPTPAAMRVVGQSSSPKNQVERLIAAFEAAAVDGGRSAEERENFRTAAGWLATFANQVALTALCRAENPSVYSR